MTDRLDLAGRFIAAMLTNSDILEAAAEQGAARGLRPEQVLAARALAQADTLLAVAGSIVTPQAPSLVVP